MTTTGEKLKGYWQEQGMPMPSGVSHKQIKKFESHHRVVLPSDLRDYFLAVNGMVMGMPHDQDQNGFSFVPLEKVTTVREESQRIGNSSILFSGADSFFVFCDYLTWCWVYAIQLSGDPLKRNQVVIVGKHGEPLVANSFSEFVDLYVCDSPKLYTG